jgi:hypothetical protein
MYSVAREWLHPRPSLVVTFGLTTAVMNGRAGGVTGWDAGRARYAVQLKGRAQHAALKPGNLRPR